MQHQWLMWSLWVNSCVIKFKLWHANRNQCSDPISSSYRTMNLINYKIPNLYNAITIIRINALTIFISIFELNSQGHCIVFWKSQPPIPDSIKTTNGYVEVEFMLEFPWSKHKWVFHLKNISIMLVILLTLPSQQMSMTSKSNGISWSFQRRCLGF